MRKLEDLSLQELEMLEDEILDELIEELILELDEQGLLEGKVEIALRKKSTKLKRLIKQKVIALGKKLKNRNVLKALKFRRLWKLYMLKAYRELGPRVRADAIKQLNQSK